MFWLTNIGFNLTHYTRYSLFDTATFIWTWIHAEAIYCANSARKAAYGQRLSSSSEFAMGNKVGMALLQLFYLHI